MLSLHMVCKARPERREIWQGGGAEGWRPCHAVPEVPGQAFLGPAGLRAHPPEDSPSLLTLCPSSQGSLPHPYPYPAPPTHTHTHTHEDHAQPVGSCLWLLRLRARGWQHKHLCPGPSQLLVQNHKHTRESSYLQLHTCRVQRAGLYAWCGLSPNHFHPHLPPFLTWAPPL